MYLHLARPYPHIVLRIDLFNQPADAMHEYQNFACSISSACRNGGPIAFDINVADNLYQDLVPLPQGQELTRLPEYKGTEPYPGYVHYDRTAREQCAQRSHCTKCAHEQCVKRSEEDAVK